MSLPSTFYKGRISSVVMASTYYVMNMLHNAQRDIRIRMFIYFIHNIHYRNIAMIINTNKKWIRRPLLRPVWSLTQMPQKYLTRFNKIATQGAPQMALDKEVNSLSRVYSYYSKFNLCLFYV